MTFGGATIPEYLQAFWYCTEFGKLKKVIIATDVYGYLYSFPSTTGRYDGILDLVSHPYQYFYSQFVWDATWAYFVSSSNSKSRGYKTITEERWLSVVGDTKEICLKNLPSDKNELQKNVARVTKMFMRLKQYCDKENITVVVITPIISTDIYNMYMECFPEVYDMVMRDLVEVFGFIIDFGYPNTYSSNKQNFSDPMHVKSDSLYIESLWKGHLNHCRYVDRHNIDDILKNK